MGERVWRALPQLRRDAWLRRHPLRAKVLTALTDEMFRIPLHHFLPLPDIVNLVFPCFSERGN